MTLYLGKKAVGVTKIVKKEVNKTKFGVTIDDWLGDVDENGNYVPPQHDEVITLDFSSIKTIPEYSMRQALISFEGKCFLDFSGLETIQKDGMEWFASAGSIHGAQSQIVGVNFSSLKRIESSGMYGFLYAQAGWLDANTVLDFNSLEYIGYSGMWNAFRGGHPIIGVLFNNLKEIGSQGLYGTFDGCSKLQTISFPSLISVQTNSFGTTSVNTQTFRQCTALTEIHFRADMQAAIEATNGYSNKWGATNATIYFDL